jgi:hypothetical protein
MRMKKRPVVSEVSRPPVLRIRHERGEILLYRREIKALEFLGVIEILVHRSVFSDCWLSIWMLS